MALRVAKIKHRELHTHKGAGCRHEGIKSVLKNARNRFTFGFVRNPLTWLQSRWAYTMRSTDGNGGGTPRWSTDFNEWVEGITTHHPNYVFQAILHRLGYEKIDGQWQPGHHAVDFVGRTEHLVNDFVKALKKANEKFDERAIRHVAPQKVCSRGDYWQKKVQYRPHLRDLVIEVNRPIFDLFGYES